MLALRLDWETGVGFASVRQIGADAGACERTVKSATVWARTSELLVLTRRGHYVSPERTVASEWRLALPQSQGAAGRTLESQGARDPRANGQIDPTQGASGTHTSRPRSSRPRSSARGNGANAPSRPRAQPKTPFLAPPCPECGKPFSQEQLADPDFRSMALAGDVIHTECIERNYARPQLIIIGQELREIPGEPEPDDFDFFSKTSTEGQQP
jgi:hypothetical protein